MFFRFILLGCSFVGIVFVFIISKLKVKHRIYKEKKIRRQRQEKFKNKMKELEIKWISNRIVIFEKCRPKIN